MKDNIELSREVLDAFGTSNINGTLVTIGEVSSDKMSGKVYIGNPESARDSRMMEIGKFDAVGDVANFNVGAESYRVINMQNGFQAVKNFIDYYVSYTSLPNFSEISYIDKNCKVSITLYTSKENEMSHTIDINTMFYGEVKNERNFKLETSNDHISYNYYECDHDVVNSSGPTWYFTVDTRKNKYSNWGKKGNKEYGCPLDLNVPFAQKIALEQLKSSNVMSDLEKINEIIKIKAFDDIIKIISELEQMKLTK